MYTFTLLHFFLYIYIYIYIKKKYIYITHTHTHTYIHTHILSFSADRHSKLLFFFSCNKIISDVFLVCYSQWQVYLEAPESVKWPLFSLMSLKSQPMITIAGFGTVSSFRTISQTASWCHVPSVSNYGSGDWRLCPELRKNDRFNMLKMNVYANEWLSPGMIAMTHLKSSFSMQLLSSVSLAANRSYTAVTRKHLWEKQ